MPSAIVFAVLFQFVMREDLQIRVAAAGSHEPVSSAHVQVIKLGVPIQEATLLDGRIQFSNLAAGRYTIIANAPGYETTYSDVTLPEDFIAIVELRAKQGPVPASPQAPPSSNTLRRLLRKLFG